MMLLWTIFLFLFLLTNAHQTLFHSTYSLSEVYSKFYQMEKDIKELKQKEEAVQTKLVQFEEQLSTNPNYTRIVSGQELIRILAKNQWNQSDCHSELFLFKPSLLKVVCLGNENVPRTVRAKVTPSKNFELVYYEVKILSGQKVYDKSQNDTIGIGFAPKAMPLDTQVGTHNGTFAYFNNGNVQGNRITGNKRNFVKFNAGDIVGCGLNLTSRQIILTKNGQLLENIEERYRFISSYFDEDSSLDNNLFFMPNDTDELFPAISLSNPGDEVEANFGPNFKYIF